MGLFKSGRKQLGGGNRAPFFKGNGKCLVSLVSAVSKKNRGGKQQTVITCKVIAAEPDADVVVGREYAYRWEEGGKFPESDDARMLGYILGFAGLRYDPNDEMVLANQLEIDVSDITDEDLIEAAREARMDKAIEALRAEMEAGEGDAWKDRACEVRMVSKDGGYTNTYASAIPPVMVEGGELSEKGKAVLSRNGWVFPGSAE